MTRSTNIAGGLVKKFSYGGHSEMRMGGGDGGTKDGMQDVRVGIGTRVVLYISEFLCEQVA